MTPQPHRDTPYVPVDTTPFNLDAARKAGYSDSEILQHLASSRNFDVAGAIKAGYSEPEIIDHLVSQPTQLQKNAQTIQALEPPPTEEGLLGSIKGGASTLWNAVTQGPGQVMDILTGHPLDWLSRRNEDIRQQSREAVGRGDYSTAFGLNLAGLMPGLGDTALAAGRSFGEGNPGAGVANTMMALAPFAKLPTREAAPTPSGWPEGPSPVASGIKAALTEGVGKAIRKIPGVSLPLDMIDAYRTAAAKAGRDITVEQAKSELQATNADTGLGFTPGQFANPVRPPMVPHGTPVGAPVTTRGITIAPADAATTAGTGLGQSGFPLRPPMVPQGTPTGAPATTEGIAAQPIQPVSVPDTGLGGGGPVYPPLAPKAPTLPAVPYVPPGISSEFPLRPPLKPPIGSVLEMPPLELPPTHAPPVTPPVVQPPPAPPPQATSGAVPKTPVAISPVIHAAPTQSVSDLAAAVANIKARRLTPKVPLAGPGLPSVPQNPDTQLGLNVQKFANKAEAYMDRKNADIANNAWEQHSTIKSGDDIRNMTPERFNKLVTSTTNSTTGGQYTEAQLAADLPKGRMGRSLEYIQEQVARAFDEINKKSGGKPWKPNR